MVSPAAVSDVKRRRWRPAGQLELRHQRQLAGRAADHLRRHRLLAGIVDRLNLEARGLVGRRRSGSAPT